MNLFNKKTGNRGFTLIELLVTIAVLAILVLLGTPRLLNYTQKAQLTRIQHDTKVMEQEMGTLMVENEVDIGGWENNNKSFNQLIAEDKLFEKEGVAEKIYAKHLARDGVLNLSKYFRETTSSNKTLSLNDEELGTGGESYPVNELPEDFSVDKTYKIVPEEYSKKINTKLKGTFYVNSDGKVYYEHGKPIPGEDKDKSLTCPTALPDYKFEHETGTIVKWYGTEQYLTIPSHFLVDGKCWPVRIIGVGAFANGNFRRVVIPDTVTKIESGAFKDATIGEIVIPHSVQHIGDGAFSGGGIDKVEVIGEPGRFEPGVFVGTEPTFRRPTPEDLDIVIHPESGTIISSTRVSSTKTTSSNSNNNQSVNTGGVGGTLIIPEQVEVPGRNEPVTIVKVHKGAFQGEGLIEVNMPYTLRRIEAYAFAGNQLDWVKIPQTVEYIGEYAFAFNQHIHSSNNTVKPTIKSIKIKDIERINDVKLGNIVDSSGSLANPLDGVEMKEYIWVTDADNFKFEVIGPGKPGIPVNPGNPAKPREPIGKEIAIASADEFNKIGTSSEYPLNGKYILTANIDLSHIDNWTPIGSYTNSTKKSPFTGSFDGNGYKIAKLTINRSTSYVGLFGATEGATIRNVALEDININGNNYVGGLVGFARSSTIDNSYATGSVSGSSDVGGLVGRAVNSTTISNSYAEGPVTGRNYVGGLVGRAESSTTITNSHATGSVESTGDWVGGLVGRAVNSTIENSYATGSVTGGRYVGGLVGSANTSTITNSYSTGSVESTGDWVGGLVGYANGTTISNSYATGSVEGSGSQVGGLVGRAESSTTISNSYATGEVTGTGNHIGGLVGSANTSTITNSYSTGSVEGTGVNIGGLVGYANGTTISNSYATGSVESTGYQVGGLVGLANNSTITNSYATGSVKGEQSVGGLVGSASDGSISNSYATGSVTGGRYVGGLVGFASTRTITNSYAAGKVTGNLDVGGLVGEAALSSTITNSYWDKETTRLTTSARGKGTGKTTVEMKSQSIYEDWDFESVWEIDDGNNYPKLR